jgi:hypothetical protein
LRYAVVQALRWCFVGRSVVNHVMRNSVILVS